MAMWSARGARLWRSLARVRRGAAGSRDPLGSLLRASSSSEAPVAAAGAAVAGDAALSRHSAGGAAAGLQHALRGVPAFMHHRMVLNSHPLSLCMEENMGTA